MANSLNTIYIQCVYGEEHIDVINHVLIPSIISSTNKNIYFACTNYNGGSTKFVTSGIFDNVSVKNFIPDSNEIRGFAKAHNDLFNQTHPSDYFIIVNPDCIIEPNAIDRLVERFMTNPSQIGIVEGRQWPFEHPKEFDPFTLRTPWASGAFCLINAKFYASIGGMEEAYFLYNEDVDLSWMCWLNNLTVIYERNAVVVHFTNGRFHDETLKAESYYSIRNFIALARKFFGDEGEKAALEFTKQHSDRELISIAINDYFSEIRGKIQPINKVIKSPYIKILGLNQYHNLR